MERRAQQLPWGWDEAIPEALWPEAMFAAIRVDPGALASPRVIATLRVWRAASDGNGTLQRECLRNLRLVGDALSQPATSDDWRLLEHANPDVTHDPDEDGTDDGLTSAFDEDAAPMPPARFQEEFTVASYSAPPRRVSSTAHAVEREARPRNKRPRDPVLLAGALDAIHALEQALAVDEEETYFGDVAGFEADQRADTIGTQKTPSGAAIISPEFSEEPPTATVALPSTGVFSSPRLVPVKASSSPPPLPPPSQSRRPPSRPERTAPKLESVARPEPRSNVARAPRPSLIHVQAMFSAAAELCRELVPLTYERRHRRFWARWREVAGDRGVRRETVDLLLATATDFPSLMAGLIAEVHDVDLDGVRAMVDQIEAGKIELDDDVPAVTRSRDQAVGPLLGASVHVAGLDLDD